MSVDAGIVISMTGDELLEFHRSFGQVLDMESDILDEASCSRLAGTAYRRENTGTDGPILRVFFRLVGKMHRDIGVESA